MGVTSRRSAGLNLQAAARALWQNRMRSTLTVLGVVIGVASAILLIAISGEDDQPVCVRGSALKADLFPTEKAIGKTVAVNQRAYRVIGVASTRALSTSVFGGGDLDAIAYLPLKAVARLAGTREVHRILA